jgi:hypothetical protein
MTMLRPLTLTLALFPSVLVVGGCGPHGPKRPSPEDMIGADPLPLALGATWTYHAVVSQYDPDTSTDTKRELEWTTSVVEAHPIQTVTSFRVKGWPTDLVEPATGGTAAGATGPAPTERTILRAGDTFLWSQDPNGSVDGAEGWFTWPLTDGQQICPDPSVVYCWTVQTGEDGYRLTYRTGPDEETYLIQPGTGVAEYTYVHHGTTLEVHATLVSYKEGKKGAMSTPAAAPATAGAATSAAK